LAALEVVLVEITAQYKMEVLGQLGKGMLEEMDTTTQLHLMTGLAAVAAARVLQELMVLVLE
jgi:hypothetical protein